ncbi:methylated-DNA--[protein]-cysteine S-methyltransferase [Rhodobacterales bacterium HKCCE3408]|nr:methylated-DNA--[protein]-cysteine S-methyltransferase [Rhodobacterales bacterium HKCCE3408]
MKAGLDTPIGPFWIEADEAAIRSAGWGVAPGPAGHPVLEQAIEELRAYFARELTVFSVPVAHGRTGLQAEVMAVMSAIPFGETRTYGAIAAEVGASAQAVGQACGANSVPVIIPCHRVLGASGLGGFSAPGGIETKVALLRHEGAASLLI